MLSFGITPTLVLTIFYNNFIPKNHFDKGETNMAVIELTKENFDKEVIECDKPVLIDF